MLYEALSYRLVKIPVHDRPDPYVHIAPGYSPVELDAMELWQIAVLLDRHHLAKPLRPQKPDDWEQRAEFYQEALEKRRAMRAEAMKKKVSR